MTRRGSNGTRWILSLLRGLPLCVVGCVFLTADSQSPPLPRDAMRSLVADIADHARARIPGFLVIAQNGDELLTLSEESSDLLASEFITAIDGLGREDLFYGYSEDNEPTPSESTQWMLAYLDRAEAVGIEVLVIDYCWAPASMDDSYERNAARGFVSFAASRRELNVIPEYPVRPFDANTEDVRFLAGVENFLYLINPEQYGTKAAFVDALADTNYDALVVDLEFDGAPLLAQDVSALRVKANGGARLVLCYLSIGEAEDYRGYWDPEWEMMPPDWLLEENPDWPGNYPVRYWNSDWRDIVFEMLDVVLSAGFDGVYLDRVDVYEEFEI